MFFAAANGVDDDDGDPARLHRHGTCQQWALAQSQARPGQAGSPYRSINSSCCCCCLFVIVVVVDVVETGRHRHRRHSESWQHKCNAFLRPKKP